MNNTLFVMGLARKAGKLLMGHDAVMSSVKSGKALTVILTCDASNAHKRELEAANFDGDTVRLSENMHEAGYAVGKKCCIFAVEDVGFKKAIDKTSIKEDL